MKNRKTSSFTISLLSVFGTMLLAWLPATAMAGNGEQALQLFFKDVHTLRADFIQVVQSEDFRKSEQSRGKLMMSRPGHFRWDYEKPYEQQIIADGQKLWIFDVDLDQVIVKTLSDALGNTPAVLLSGSADLGDKFNIKNYNDNAGNDGTVKLDWVELTPKDENAGFQLLRLGFAKDLRQMVLLDAFGQETRISFSDLQRNPTIDPKLFEFTPPPGVDVLTE